MPKFKNKHSLLIAVPILTIAMLSGCGGGDSADDASDYNSLWVNEFQSCGSNCHRPDGGFGTDTGPDLSTRDAFHSNLVKKNAYDYPSWTLRGGDCDATAFIEPSNAAKSTIITSVIESYSTDIVAAGDCTTTSFNFHRDNSVSYTNEAAVIDWINAGALKSSSVSTN